MAPLSVLCARPVWRPLAQLQLGDGLADVEGARLQRTQVLMELICLHAANEGESSRRARKVSRWMATSRPDSSGVRAVSDWIIAVSSRHVVEQCLPLTGTVVDLWEFDWTDT